MRRIWLELLCAALTLTGTGVLAAAGVIGGDEPAHLYRAYLAQHGLLVWDNAWYSGMSLPAYSLLYAPLSAVLGLVPLALLGGVAGSALLASLLRTAYGVGAAALPAVAFAALGCLTLVTGEFPYALAIATALAALVLIQRGRPGWAALFIILTAGFSPLAFLLLVAALAALAVTHLPWRRSGWVLLVGTTTAVMLLAATSRAFPDPGTLPFESRWLIWALALNGLGVAVTAPVRRARTLFVFFAVWAAVCIACYVVPNPAGRNVVRPETYALPLLLLAGQLRLQSAARQRPRGALREKFRRTATAATVLLSLAAATVYDAPLTSLFPDGLHNQRAFPAAWAPAETFLRTHASPQYRVEEVPTPGHWEAYWLARAGVPLVRGWYRQTDLLYNAAADGLHVQRGAYLHWLHTNAIRYVVMPPHGVETLGEAALLDSGRSALQPVWSDDGWRAWAVPDPAGLLAGRRAAHLTRFGHSTLRGWVRSPGRYLLRVRYNRYWTVTQGHLCTRPGPRGMTELVVAARGAFALASQEHPWDVIGDALDNDLAQCPSPVPTPTDVRAG